MYPTCKVALSKDKLRKRRTTGKKNWLFINFLCEKSQLFKISDPKVYLFIIINQDKNNV